MNLLFLIVDHPGIVPDTGRAHLRPRGEHLKVHGYHIVPRGSASLSDLLQHIASLDLEDRLRTISGTPTRLEFCEERRGFWMLDFTLIRRKGPGRASPSAEVEDFDLEDDEGFGEETAALYDPASGFMVMQYNHYGPRNARIQTYLHGMSRTMVGEEDHAELPDDEYGFDLNPLITVEATDRLENFGFVKAITASFHVPGVLARPEARRRSLGSFLELPLMGGAELVQFQVSAGRKKGSYLSKSRVAQVVRDLLAAREEISDLTVIAKETEDAPREAIDFLDARLEVDVPVQLVGRRYPRDQRLRSLAGVFASWRDEGMLNV